MTVCSGWECMAPVALWIGAALLLLVGLATTIGVWMRWRPTSGNEVSGMPLLVRWIPALLLGCGCGATVWLAASAAEPEMQIGVAAATAFVVLILTSAGLGRAGERAVRLRQESAYWDSLTERVNTQLRSTLRQEELLGFAARTVMQELEATSVRVFLLGRDSFELAASLPAPVGKAEQFEKQSVLAQAFSVDGRTPFLEFVNSASGRAGGWCKPLKDVTTGNLQAEQRRLESLGAEVGLGFWRNAKLAGFFLIGGRLTSDPLSAPQRRFAIDLCFQVGLMLDVVDAVEQMAQEQSVAERTKVEREMAVQVRSRMTPPEMAEVAGLEYGVSVEPVAGSCAGFCDTVILPGSSLGVVMAETSAGGLQLAVEMVRLQALLRSRFYVYGEDLREMLESVERALPTGDNAMPPVRLLLGRYHAASRRFVYLNADYLPPVLLKNRSDGSETRRLAATGRALAGEGPANWKVQEIELRRRDLLLAISPGLLHRADALEKWGENRLLETMLELEKHPAAAIARRLINEAAEPDNDDQLKSERSVIVLRPSEAAVRPVAIPVRGEG